MSQEKAKPLCPDCGGAERFVGPIPATDVFAGNVLQKPLPSGSLYRCIQCGLGFRWPRLAKEKLDDLYAQGSDTTWTAGVDRRRDWRVAHEWLTINVPADAAVLDVGCFDGGFLESLTRNYRCFGIEIHPQARNHAERKGIKIIGTDFSDLKGRFDCITAFDVIEHVESPRRFLECGIGHLDSGGRLVVSTGNLDSLTFRFMGSRYWYCTIAEHISFISPDWVRKQASALDVEIEYMAFFSHAECKFPQKAKQTAANLLYRFWPGLVARLRRMGMGGTDARRFPELAGHPPAWASARDHFLFVLRKT